MILVNTIFQLAFPNPTSTEFVTISSFIEENIAGLQAELLYVRLWRLNELHFRKIEIASLNVRYAKVWNGSSSFVFALAIDSNSTFKCSNCVEPSPDPSLGQHW